MKKINYFIYFLLILILGYFFISLGNEAVHLNYYNSVSSNALEEKDYNEYIEVFMNYNNYFEHRKDPVYHGISSDNNFDFIIMQSYIESGDIKAILNHFYFIDHFESYDHFFLDQASIDLFNANNKLAMFRLELLMDGEDEPTFTPIEIYSKNGKSKYIDKVKSKPLDLTYNYNSDNENYFRYITFDSEDNVVWKESQHIEKIEISFVDYTKVVNKDDKPIVTKLLTLSHHDNANIKNVDIFENNNNIAHSTNFNGHIDNYVDDSNFTNYEVEKDNYKTLIKPYNYARNKWIVILTIIVVIITYAFFFLTPTIDYFKNKTALKKHTSKTKK